MLRLFRGAGVGLGSRPWLRNIMVRQEGGTDYSQGPLEINKGFGLPTAKSEVEGTGQRRGLDKCY